jgi:5,10-methylenetetrahydromethanopterin reductase
MRDVFVTLTSVADRTRRISLGTRVTDPYIRHPALTAVAIATLDEVSQGRAILGLGAGGSGFRELGIERVRPVRAIREAIDVIRRLWTGEEFAFEGQVVSWRGGQLDFEVRDSIPIVIVGRSPLLLELAGEVADGSIIATGVSREGIAWARERVEMGERKSGRLIGSTELLHMTYLVIDLDLPAARRAAKRALAAGIAGSYPAFEFLKVNKLEVPEELSDYLSSGRRDLMTVAEMIPDSFVPKLAIAGPPDHCIEQLNGLISYGIDHPLITPVPSTTLSELETIEMFLAELLPALR